MQTGWIILLAVSACAAMAAPAGRQSISCLEKKNRNQHTVEMSFDPSESREWRRRPWYTSARVTFTVPGRGEYSGEFGLDQMFAVNELRTADEESANFFGAKPYSTFHGTDHAGRYNSKVLIPADVLGRSEDAFTGLLSIRPDILDEGHYQIPLECRSRFRRASGSTF